MIIKKPPAFLNPRHLTLDPRHLTLDPRHITLDPRLSTKTYTRATERETEFSHLPPH